ncbi:MAG TPA: CSLREA domain-containing protein [Rhodanobacteraceae bacterium]|nr:CSLREA domain-containing protein [Rhodanobacteraceae bacterium]
MNGHRSLTTAAALVAVFLTAAAPAATITVNSTADTAADDGNCTLREALAAATTNTASGAMPGECAAGEPLPVVDTIAFAIPGSGVHTIQPTSVIPRIEESVVIDGYTQPGSAPNTLAIGDDAILLIEIDGSLMPVGNDLFDFPNNGSTIRGLVINRMQGTSIYCGASTFSSSDNVIEGSFFATDAAGTAFLGFNYTSVRVDGANNRIGGTAPASRNVFAGTGGSKTGTVMIQGPDNVVQGNYIGVDATGTVALPSNATTNGLEIGLTGAATNTQIGGDVAGAGNVIFNSNVSINLNDNGSSGATIQGNHIGVNAAGDAVLGVGVLGIEASDMPDVTIGGSTSGAGNVMAGFNTVISIGNGTNVTVQGNHIGTDASGTRPLSNYGNGILVGRTGVGSIIGGTDPGEGNTIAYSCGQGILFSGADHWPILGNSIFANHGLGIALSSPDVPTQNDDGDGDTGNNDQQNYPVITSATISNGTASISGTLNSAAATTFRIEFFANAACNRSGYGAGETLIGTIDVATDADGNASFGPLSFAAPDGADITATATDPDGNTSEFSACVGPHNHIFTSRFDGACVDG